MQEVKIFLCNLHRFVYGLWSYFAGVWHEQADLCAVQSRRPNNEAAHLKIEIHVGTDKK